ncbi:DUF92 domain-containing protein [Fodinibius saliphilus]|uniref:DUF92 domain-containing protein n=1 Tax=Fodinibius saliphilus TaxID=1920650 RepID=UPI00148738C9|nr:DUF92 domain-containing protein [Fodinibius saliphilus]
MDRKLNALFCFFLVLIFISAAEVQQQWHVILGLLLATAFSFLAFLIQRLTLDGMFAAIVVGVFVLGFGGWSTAGILLIFFISSITLSKNTKKLQADLPKRIRRSGNQVWANGFWLVISLILYVIFDSQLFIVAAVGTIATATADTWSTEIGTRADNSTYLITNFRKVSIGTDGGVSIKGTIAGLLGSALIAAISIYVFSLQLALFICIFAAGFLGSVADSYFGAIFQRNNSSVTLPVINQTIPITNNIVNGISTGIGGVLAAILKLIVI